MNKSDGDKIAKSLVSETMAWFEVDPAKHTVNECVKFAKKLVAELMADDLKEVKPKDKGQLLAYVGKSLDQIARLVQFSAGQPDSRQEVSVADLLPLLSEEEFQIFQRAIDRVKESPAIGAPKLSQMH